MVAISENKIKPSCFIEFYTRPALLDSVSCSSCGRADSYLSVCRRRRWLQMITHRPHSCAGLVKPFQYDRYYRWVRRHLADISRR